MAKVPSPQWTEEDRRAVIIAITDEMSIQSRSATPVRAERVFDWSVKLRLVLYDTAETLEANRQELLAGLSFTK